MMEQLEKVIDKYDTYLENDNTSGKPFFQQKKMDPRKIEDACEQYLQVRPGARGEEGGGGCLSAGTKRRVWCCRERPQILLAWFQIPRYPDTPPPLQLPLSSPSLHE